MQANSKQCISVKQKYSSRTWNLGKGVNSQQQFFKQINYRIQMTKDDKYQVIVLNQNQQRTTFSEAKQIFLEKQQTNNLKNLVLQIKLKPRLGLIKNQQMTKQKQQFITKIDNKSGQKKEQQQLIHPNNFIPPKNQFSSRNHSISPSHFDSKVSPHKSQLNPQSKKPFKKYLNFKQIEYQLILPESSDEYAQNNQNDKQKKDQYQVSQQRKEHSYDSYLYQYESKQTTTQRQNEHNENGSVRNNISFQEISKKQKKIQQINSIAQEQDSLTNIRIIKQSNIKESKTVNQLSQVKQFIQVKQEKTIKKSLKSKQKNKVQVQENQNQKLKQKEGQQQQINNQQFPVRCYYCFDPTILEPYSSSFPTKNIKQTSCEICSNTNYLPQSHPYSINIQEEIVSKLSKLKEQNAKLQKVNNQLLQILTNKNNNNKSPYYQAQ